MTLLLTFLVGAGTALVVQLVIQLYVVPKGVRHNPVAEEECHVMLIERKSTRHTGSEITERTRSLEEQLRR